MTTKELICILSDYPEDTVIAYKHNKFGRIDIDKCIFSEEELLSGNKIKIITFEGESKEN